MQPVKITIQGDYIDCQIYRGRLYLWCFDGALKVYDWGDLVRSLSQSETDSLTLTFCFLDGNYLYKSSLVDLFHDSEFKNLLLAKFDRVADQEYVISRRNLSKFLFGAQDTPTDILPTDTEIYSNKLYFITEQGLFSSTAHRDKSDRFPVSSKCKKIWDCNLQSIKANKYPQMALSGGTEGLFELSLYRYGRIDSYFPKKRKIVENSIVKIGDSHSSFSNYTFLSIYNSSLVDSAYMALFKWHTRKQNSVETYHREFENTVTETQIFKSLKKSKRYLSWGVDDKIYRATETGFEISRFNNYANEEKGEQYFTSLRKISLHAWKGDVIGGGTAYFGTIVECENALVVLLSSGGSYTIEGPITRWRVYPRSLNYENHLHVIHDDRIEIYSFNQDYFLNQKEKNFGIEYRDKKSFFNRSED